MSPANRASPSASGGRGVSGTVFPVPVYQASTTSPLRSPAVKTAWTPGSASAAEVSMDRMRALGCGLRTKQACSMPGRVMSSTKVPAPVSSRASSTRCTRLPA